MWNCRLGTLRRLLGRRCSLRSVRSCRTSYLTWKLTRCLPPRSWCGWTRPIVNKIHVPNFTRVMQDTWGCNLQPRSTIVNPLIPVMPTIRKIGMSRVGSCILLFHQNHPITVLRREGSSPIDPISRKNPNSHCVFSTSGIGKKPANVSRAVTFTLPSSLQLSLRPNEVHLQGLFVGVEVVLLQRVLRGKGLSGVCRLC